MMDAIIQWLAAATLNQTPEDFAAGIALALLSVTGVLLSTSLHPPIRITGFLCGLLSQPLWFYIAITSYNLGLFINSIFFTAMWFYRFVPALRAKKISPEAQ